MKYSQLSTISSVSPTWNSSIQSILRSKSDDLFPPSPEDSEICDIFFIFFFFFQPWLLYIYIQFIFKKSALSCSLTSQKHKNQRKRRLHWGGRFELLSPLLMQIFKVSTSTVIKPNNQPHFTNAVITECWLNPERLFVKWVRSINPLNPS